jgi:hypothetical protein
MKNMNFIRYIIATLGLFVFIFLYEMLIHDYILIKLYQTTATVWRDFAEMEANISAIFIYQLGVYRLGLHLFFQDFPKMEVF